MAKKQKPPEDDGENFLKKAKQFKNQFKKHKKLF